MVVADLKETLPLTAEEVRLMNAYWRAANYLSVGVGAIISSFTGRRMWLSAVRMFFIGTLAAAITYLVGSIVGVSTGL